MLHRTPADRFRSPAVPTVTPGSELNWLLVPIESPSGGPSTRSFKVPESSRRRWQPTRIGAKSQGADGRLALSYGPGADEDGRQDMAETAAAQRIADVGMSARTLCFAGGEGGRADHRPPPRRHRPAARHRRPAHRGRQPVVVIEHNLDVIAAAGWIVDLGSEGGKDGAIVAERTPETIAAHHATSHTGRYLRERLAVTPQSNLPLGDVADPDTLAATTELQRSRPALIAARWPRECVGFGAEAAAIG